MSRRPFWQLPPGVSRGTWDYVQSDKIANDYDRYFADHRLMQLDLEFLAGHLPAVQGRAIPVIADLGCGTGRVARHLVPRGYRVLNIDLSDPMLRRARQQADDDASACVRANLVELDFLRDACLDLAVCLFSSLGMIRGRSHRHAFLSATRRSLRPKAKIVLHVHNRYRSCWDPGGPSWLLRTRIVSWFRRGTEYGDRVYAYRGLPSMFLHIFSRREITSDLRSAGFEHIETFPIRTTSDALLPASSRFADLRAGGFFAVARAP